MGTGRSALLLEVLTALPVTPITEADIVGKPSELIHGLAEGGRVWVNPGPQVVDTVIHELLHTLHPSWSERYVRNRTTFLINRLTQDEIRQIYRQYQEKVGGGKRRRQRRA